MNQPKPEWLKIGKTIETKIVDGSDIDYPPTVGTVIAYPTSVFIPAKNVKITFQGQVVGGASWGAKRDDWLSPNGKRLVVQAEGAARMYKILGEGSYRELDIELPELTYDTRLRGHLYDWHWSSDDVLVGSSELENQDTGKYEESRIYVYHVSKKILSRLNFESLKLNDLEGLEIVKIGSEENYIKIRLGEKLFTVEADLKPLPQLLNGPHPKKHSRQNTSSAKIPPSILPEIKNPQPVSNNLLEGNWLEAIAVVLF